MQAEGVLAGAVLERAGVRELHAVRRRQQLQGGRTRTAANSDPGLQLGHRGGLADSRLQLARGAEDDLYM